MVQKYLWNMLYVAVDEFEEVTRAHEQVSSLVDPLRAELGFSRYDGIDAAINALEAELIKAAFEIGWKYAKHPDLLIFEDGSTADPA